MFYSRCMIRMPCLQAGGRKARHNPLLAMPLMLLLASGSHAGLDIDAAVRLALADDPLIAASQARSQALQDSAIADGQLPDPQLRTGIYNLPTDDFDIDEEPSTQLRLGVQQAFPRGKTLHYRQRQGEWKATAASAGAELESRKLVLDVRGATAQRYGQVCLGIVEDITKPVAAHRIAGRAARESGQDATPHGIE